MGPQLKSPKEEAHPVIRKLDPLLGSPFYAGEYEEGGDLKLSLRVATNQNLSTGLKK